MATKKPKPVPAVRAVGRPTKFREEFCGMLIEHMEAGNSYDTFGGEIGVCKQTLYTWEQEFPQFLDSKNLAFLKGQRFWERLAIDNIISSKDGGSLNGSVWIFNMKNRFKWTDRVELTGTVQQSRELADLSDEELDKLLE